MRTEIHVFVGPSLPPSVRPAVEGITYHGPVAQGDVYALVSRQPLAIAIADGYFERVPAVWHKELLWAMAEGVHVFGAASMGALRAAELADYGMVGIGEVYEEFASQRLQDDDEVAVVHGDAESDYRQGSEPMVNVRATLDLARATGVITEESRTKLIAHEKSLFYPNRHYAELLRWAGNVLPAVEWEALSCFLQVPENRVNRKRKDALALLRALAELRADPPPEKRVPWLFQHTDAWEQVRMTIAHRSADDVEGAQVVAAEVLELLRDDPVRERRLRDEATLRFLSIASARRDGFVPSPTDVADALARHCREHGLADASALKEWMKAQDLTESELERLMRDQACLQRTAAVAASGVQLALLDLLRLESSYGELRRQARDMCRGAPTSKRS